MHLRKTAPNRYVVGCSKHMGLPACVWSKLTTHQVRACSF
jgi:hypothetical protein